MYVPYENIEVSKQKGALLAEYAPQDTIITIGGKVFNVTDAWVEKPHYEKLYGDEIIDNFYICVVNIAMPPGTFTEQEWRDMNIRHFIKEYGYRNSQIWFYVAKAKEEVKDSILVEYRHPYNKKERKGFMLLRKK